MTAWLVVTSPLHRMVIVAWRGAVGVMVISWMTVRKSRLRSAIKVVGASQTAGTCSVSWRTASCSSSVKGKSVVFWATAYSRSRLPSASNAPFQRFSSSLASDQSVLRVNGIVLALGQAYGVARPFKPKLPSHFARLAFLLQRLQCREQCRELGRFHRLKEAHAGRLIQIALAKGLAGRVRVADSVIPADIPRAMLAVLDLHPPSAAATDDQSLEQGLPLTGSAGVAMNEVVHVGAQLLPVTRILLLADVGGVDAVRYADSPRPGALRPRHAGWSEA